VGAIEFKPGFSSQTFFVKPRTAKKTGVACLQGHFFRGSRLKMTLLLHFTSHQEIAQKQTRGGLSGLWVGGKQAFCPRQPEIPNQFAIFFADLHSVNLARYLIEIEIERLKFVWHI
jgi:hypothetical protein